MYEDKILVCKDCGKEFVFTAGEQEFFAQKGLDKEPKRCKNCRMARKNNSTDKPLVELFETTCSKCGGIARVRFQPSRNRPVYCSQCFAEIKNR